jgi:hypothetical protein
MDKLLFWLGIGAAQKGAESKTPERRLWVVSLIADILIAVLIAVVVSAVGQPEAALKTLDESPSG